ncbi:MAG: PTS sugar transporter subunit IIA [Deltaproteobacteria bacterium]|jgi:mannitol/fructose-specific phosphotransferase system IIA component (Ntr-type)|nr:PTS sugar transporter subunit IIA [Deltaproteobacteria bacterium]
MQLDKLITSREVWLDFKAGNKDQALTELCRFACSLMDLNLEPILQVVKQRETLGSTAMGGGVAIPHGKTNLVDNAVLFLARTAPGEALDFDSPDGVPVSLVALILSPLIIDSDHLKLLALLGKILKSPQNVKILMEAPNSWAFADSFLMLSGQTPYNSTTLAR